MKLNIKVIRLLLRAHRVPPIRFNSTAAAVEDVLPHNWTELGQRIEKQLLQSSLPYLRTNYEQVKESLVKRHVEADVDKLVTMLERYETVTQHIKDLEREKSDHKPFRNAKSQEEKDELKERGIQIKQTIEELKTERRLLKDELLPMLTLFPNVVHPYVDVGGYEDSTVLHIYGEKKDFSFPIRNHIELGEQLDVLDYRGSSSASVRGLYYLKGAAAMLEMSLLQYAMQKAVTKGFVPIITPDIIRTEMVEGCGFHPRGPSSQVFHVTSNHHSKTNLCLAGTAELPLAGMFVGKTIPFEQLPIRLVAFGRCYRAEAGGYELSSKGLYRVHQFSKVELFGLTSQETGNESGDLLGEMVSLQKEILSDLGLHYRVLDMASCELGAPAYRKFDLEAWMPGRGEYGEVTSASNCTDYQSRRLSITYPNQDQRRDKRGLLENKHVHTVNATACAVPRIIIALLENNQQEDGSVILPKVLRPFLTEQYWHIKQN